MRDTSGTISGMSDRDPEHGAQESGERYGRRIWLSRSRAPMLIVGTGAVLLALALVWVVIHLLW